MNIIKRLLLIILFYMAVFVVVGIATLNYLDQTATGKGISYRIDNFIQSLNLPGRTGPGGGG